MEKEINAEILKEKYDGKVLYNLDSRTIVSWENIIKDFKEFGEGFESIYTYINENLLGKNGNCELIYEEDGPIYCSECGKFMLDGFFVDNWKEVKYYCSEECLFKNYTKKEYKKMYKEGDAYYTDWL